MMEGLSQAAVAMLKRGHWHETERDPAVIARLLERAGRPPLQAAIHFQAQYGGLEYIARDGHGFHFDLFQEGTKIEHVQLMISEEEDGSWYFDIGSSRLAQINYCLRQDGVVCAAGNEASVPIAASVEMYIENDAVINEMLARQSRWWQVPLGVFDRADLRLDALAMDSRSILQRASDQYTTWWHNQDSLIRRCVVHGEGAEQDVVHGYFRSMASAKAFVIRVKNLITFPPEIYPYPA